VSECGESERAAAYAIAFSGGGEGTRENGGGVLFCGFVLWFCNGCCGPFSSFDAGLLKPWSPFL